MSSHLPETSPWPLCRKMQPIMQLTAKGSLILGQFSRVVLELGHLLSRTLSEKVDY